MLLQLQAGILCWQAQHIVCPVAIQMPSDTHSDKQLEHTHTHTLFCQPGVQKEFNLPSHFLITKTFID